MLLAMFVKALSTPMVHNGPPQPHQGVPHGPGSHSTLPWQFRGMLLNLAQLWDPLTLLLQKAVSDHEGVKRKKAVS